jgi:hypothetical protein
MTRLLYVERDYSGNHPPQCQAGVEALVARLRQEMDVDMAVGLGDHVLRLMLTGDYDVLLTHFPYCRADVQGISTADNAAWCRALYGRSHRLLSEVSELSPGTQIIVYTGADHNATIAQMIGEVADQLVVKTGQWEQDAEAILAQIPRPETAVRPAAVSC